MARLGTVPFQNSALKKSLQQLLWLDELLLAVLINERQGGITTVCIQHNVGGINASAESQSRAFLRGRNFDGWAAVGTNQAEQNRFPDISSHPSLPNHLP